MKIWKYVTKKSVVWLLIFTLFLILLEIITVHFHNTKEVFITKISSQCAGIAIPKRQACLEANILRYVDKNPTATKELFDTIWKLLGNGGLPDDARIFSPIVHDVGMLLAMKGISIEDSLRVCGLSFRGGCIHGIFMETIDRNYKKVEPDDLIKECTSLRGRNTPNNSSFIKNCIHGVGHELVANVTGSLNDTLLLCNNMPSAFVDQCVYGVFMEYSKGETRIGHHSEKPVGKKEYNCLLVDNSFKKACYISVGFYKQYEVDSEPWEHTYRFCENFSSKDREDCFNGVGGALLFSNAFMKERALAVCKSLPEDVRDYCVGSV